ncbi:HD domain-containing protein [Caldibacillus thermolactis]|uniref:HD domain-containing protein n=1 Tax=Pallidibacillus thermolactis TaxID=251051 RepID=A0ABT2WGS4_9BACI|nr:HD domain-containing phosphohydrolase [Pallidibacillus thermolactis]MCU9593879.1 HD domain-containing protein [Pallidibacillus thermolactis]
MKVKLSEVKEGYILLEDIFGLTKHPIVPKNTVLTKETIEVLKAFLVKEVNVSNEKIERKNNIVESVNRLRQSSRNVLQKNPNEDSVTQNQTSVFEQKYLESVEMFKKQFVSWQSGSLVDINHIRNIMIPLFNELIENPVNLLFLQHYVNTPQDYLYHHAIAVGVISGYLAKRLQMSQGDCYQITLAGCLSDCGMAKLNPAILQKSKIASEDIKEIKMHPSYSYKMIKDIPSLTKDAKIAILQHHERLDGSGYPFKEKGAKIHHYAKIIAIADVYNAMVCKRVYKDKVSPFRALEILLREHFGQFSIAILETLINVIAPLTINAHVELSTTDIGKILYIDLNYPTRPVIELEGCKKVISLMDEKDIYIRNILRS